MKKFILLTMLLSFTACDNKSPDEKTDVIESKAELIEPTVQPITPALSNENVLSKASINLNADIKNAEVLLTQHDATFKVNVNVNGKSETVFERKYESVKEYKELNEFYGEVSLNIYKKGEIYTDENGAGMPMLTDGISVYVPPEESHIFVYKDGKFVELPVFSH